MSGPHHRVRPWAMVAPLTLVTAAATLIPLTAGARPGIHGHSARSNARVMAGEADIGQVYPKPVLKPSTTPTVPQPRWVPVHTPKPSDRRHHTPGPKSNRPTHPQQAMLSPTVRAAFFQPPHRLALMLLNHAVLDMKAAGASPNLLAFVNQPQNLVSTPLDMPKPLTDATRIQVFNSYAGIVQAFASHHIAPDTRAIVYDNERSTGTPAAELEHPVQYCGMAATLLHRHGLKYIASPGFDLSGSRPANGDWFQQFVRAGLMKCGRYADYLDIQDQLQQGTTTYARDAQAAAILLHQMNPRAKLLMGLSTSPSGRLSTAGQLWRAYQDTSRFVNGYWMNVPHNVSGHSRPAAAIQFLQKVITQAH